MGLGVALQNVARRAIGLPPLGVPSKQAIKVSGADLAGLDIGGRLKGSSLYLAFENVFYRADAVIPHLQSDFVPLLKGCCVDNRTVVDLGVGRGEFLSLLTAEGFNARGCEINDEEQAGLAQEGFDVAHTDARSYLASMDSETVGAITAIHVVEHLSPDYLVDVLGLIGEKLAPGGVVILETPNVHNPEVAQYYFWLDAGHIRPWPLETLQFYLMNAGIGRFEYWYSVPSAEHSGWYSAGVSECANAALIGRKL